ncbi:hypothetical protein FH609_012845 [Streptomyces sp. 3MP-14]|uniref:Uncharacterized protein n=1 Tax=Streptomyces mimosae TaxID=2586635 RepID=A0A5N6AHD1_9ACTN|nr:MULTISPECIES: hypothetical protein [Streptomyces]KAB8167260.1 hypothetical protein FH607_010295 [Streptomyces mimosae]KAB8177200.1 hypothetical protein FH609_012845 [Streptomyces sp. 3MP-14]
MKHHHEPQRRVVRRHRFEPARLVLGLCLLPIAVLFLLHATGETQLSLVLRFLLLPCALALAAVVAVTALTVRRARGPRALGDGRENANGTPPARDAA